MDNEKKVKAKGKQPRKLKTYGIYKENFKNINKEHI